MVNRGIKGTIYKLVYNNNKTIKIIRDHMLNIIKEVVLEIYCFCYSAYRHHSTLQFDSSPYLLRSVLNKETHWLFFILFGDPEAPQVDPFNNLLQLYG